MAAIERERETERRRIWFRVTWWSWLIGVSLYPNGTKWLHLLVLKIPLKRVYVRAARVKRHHDEIVDDLEDDAQLEGQRTR